MTKNLFPDAREARKQGLLAESNFEKRKILREKNAERKLKTARNAINAKRQDTVRKNGLLRFLIQDALDGSSFSDIQNLNSSDIEFFELLGAEITLIYDSALLGDALEKQIEFERKKEYLSLRINDLLNGVQSYPGMLHSCDQWSGYWDLAETFGIETDRVPWEYRHLDPSLAWERLHIQTNGEEYEGLGAIARFQNWFDIGTLPEESVYGGSAIRPLLLKLRSERKELIESFANTQKTLEDWSGLDSDDVIHRIEFGRLTSFGDDEAYEVPFHPKWIPWLVDHPFGKKFVGGIAECVLKSVKKRSDSFSFIVLPQLRKSKSKGSYYNFIHSDYIFSKNSVLKGPDIEFLPYLLKAKGYNLKISKEEKGCVATVAF